MVSATCRCFLLYGPPLGSISLPFFLQRQHLHILEPSALETQTAILTLYFSLEGLHSRCQIFTANCISVWVISFNSCPSARCLQGSKRQKAKIHIEIKSDTVGVVDTYGQRPGGKILRYLVRLDVLFLGDTNNLTAIPGPYLRCVSLLHDPPKDVPNFSYQIAYRFPFFPS